MDVSDRIMNLQEQGESEFYNIPDAPSTQQLV